MNSNNRKSTFC